MKMVRSTFKELGRWSGVYSPVISPASHHRGMPSRDRFADAWTGPWAFVPTTVTGPLVK